MSMPRPLRLTLKGFGVPNEALDQIESFDIEKFRSDSTFLLHQFVQRAQRVELKIDLVEQKLDTLLSIINSKDIQP